MKRKLKVKDIVFFILAFVFLIIGVVEYRQASYYAALFWVGVSIYTAIKQYKSIDGSLADPSMQKKIAGLENVLITMLLAPFMLVLVGVSILLGMNANAPSDFVVVVLLIMLGAVIGVVLYRQWVPKK
jgi:hypothetical protein